MASLVKRIDQTRHEMKALRYLLEFHPHSMASAPRRDDFQIPDARLIYDVLVAAASRSEAEARIAALELEETDVDSFLRLGGTHYHVYPDLIRERGEQFRRGDLQLQSAG
jgi:hypothetical protein